MKFTASLRVTAAAALGIALGAGYAAGASAIASPSTTHALFVQTDGATGNQILSYVRGGDGTVSFAGHYATGGDGLTAADAVADPLSSQGSLQLADHRSVLIATNAGSDSVSVFAVNGATLTRTQVIGSGGLFPNSVAVDGDLVAVLNSGGDGTVAMFRLHNGTLQAIPGDVRGLALGGTNPPNFLHGAGQVGFSPNGRHLVVSTKLSTNSYEVFSVSSSGQLGSAPVTTLADNAVPYAFTFDAAGQLVSVEASNSSLAVYDVAAGGALTSVGSVSDGQTALCWLTAARGYYFGDNAASGNVSSFTLGSGGVPTVLNATAATAHAGTTDSAASPDGDFLYVESGGSGTLDAYAVGAAGTLTPIETIFNIPVASEGIAVS